MRAAVLCEGAPVYESQNFSHVVPRDSSYLVGLIASRHARWQSERCTAVDVRSKFKQLSNTRHY